MQCPIHSIVNVPVNDLFKEPTIDFYESCRCNRLGVYYTWLKKKHFIVVLEKKKMASLIYLVSVLDSVHSIC